MKALNPISLSVLITICLFQPAVPHRLSAQTVTWTSSHPDIVSVDANGIVEMTGEPQETTNVTITAKTTQNGLTVSSTKIIEVDACSACFMFKSSIDTQAREYCGVKLSNGQCWLDRNLGASRVATGYYDTQAYGSAYRNDIIPANICPEGWKIPTVQDLLSGWSSALGVELQINVSRWQDHYLAMAAGPLKVPASCPYCSAGYNVAVFWIVSTPGYMGWESNNRFHTSRNSTPVGARCLKNQ